MDAFGLVIKSTKAPLPLKRVSVEAAVNGYVLGILSSLTYLNETPDPVEVLFRFPLEASHAVVSLTAVINDRKIKADIREKEEARAAYDDAIASGQSAALGEEKSGDIFSIALGNLPPQKSAEIHLKIVGELQIDAEGKTRFSLPSTLKPRYTPSGSVDPLAPVSAPGDQVEHGKVEGINKFTLTVLNAAQIAAVTSPTHTISTFTDTERDAVIVTLGNEVWSLGTDLVVQVESKNPHQAAVKTERGLEGDGKFMNNQAVMLNFFPDFEHVEPVCEFIFLVDRSGSMSGSYIDSARDTLMLFMKSLPENSQFNIFGFGSSFEKLFPKSVKYTEETVGTAMEHLRDLRANLGGTELLNPLDAIFKSSPAAGCSRQVFVLTDGSVSNTQRCVDKVKQYAATTRCFTFGIGSGASTALVEGLAKAGKGSAEFVKQGERMQPKVIRSLKRALQPAVTDVTVTFDLSGQQGEILQSPQTLPPIYSGERLVAYGIISGVQLPLAGSATLKGLIGDQELNHSIRFEITPGDSVGMATIHHLAGKALISDWQNERKSKDSIVKLSIESSVISSHTAFIAVDEESTEAITGAMKTFDLQARAEYKQVYQQQQLSGLRAQVQQVEGVMASNIDRVTQRGEKLEDLEVRSAALNSQARVFQKSATNKKSAGFSFGGLFSGLFGSKSSAPPPPAAASSAPSYEREESIQDLCMDDCMESEEMMSSDDDSECLAAPMMMSSAPPPAPRMMSSAAPMMMSSAPPPAPMMMSSGPPPPRLASSKPVDTLTALITAQGVNGSWGLAEQLAKLLGKSLQELKAGCPKDVSETVWATVLALAVLKKSFVSQQDEWELVAMKAESWLKKQSLPGQVTQQDLFTAADKVL